MRYEDIARVCHEANRALQIVNGDPISPPWDELDGETQTSATSGVDGVIRGNTPEMSHESWCEFKLFHGWRYGHEKNTEAKTHPCLVPYDELPPEQKLKDALFVAVVQALT